MLRYIETLFRFKFRFFLLLVALPTVVAAAVVLIYPSYKASAQLWVDNPSYFGSTPAGWSQYLTPAQNESDSLAQLLATRSFSSELFKGLATSIPDPVERANAVAASKITIGSNGSHLIIVLDACDRPGYCIAVLDAAIAVLRDEQVANEKAAAAAGAAFVTTQLTDAQNTLNDAQSQLQRYVSTHPTATTDSDSQLSTLANKAKDLQGRVQDLQNQLDKDRYIASVSTALIQSGPRVIDPPQLGHGGLIGDGSGLRKGAMFAGAAAAFGIAYLVLLTITDKTVRDPREIEHRLKMRVLTTIPSLRSSERF